MAAVQQTPFLSGNELQEPQELQVAPQAACSTNALLGFQPERSLGVVYGITVRSRNLGADIGAGFKALVGGEIKTMTTLCEKAREEAYVRMLQQAAERGANGVVAARYEANSLMPGITEVIAYGTAVTDGGVPAAAAAAGEAAEPAIPAGLVSTANELPSYMLHQSLGVVHGITVRSRNAIAAIGGGLKSLVGGEIKTYKKLCEDTRREAYTRMAAAAAERGADGILAMRYDTNEVADGITEVVAYGTAVCSRPLLAGAGARGEAPAGLERMVTSSNALPGLKVQQSLGLVYGISVRGNNVFRSIGAGFKSIVGGEIHSWSKLCLATREEAFERMLEQAREKGAKGVVAMRYDSNQVCERMIEVIAYGTAVTDAATGGAAPTSGGQPPLAFSTDVDIPGHAARRTLGTVRGVSVQSVNLALKVGAGLKGVVGGEIRNFTRMAQRAREQAFVQMLLHAAEMGATGVAGMRFESNNPVQATIEVVAYGTAVSDGSQPVPEPADGTPSSMVTSTTNEILGRTHRRSLGVTRGVTVRSRNVFANIGASMRATFVGHEIKTWTKLCEDARAEALQRMLEDAAAKGAQGVLALRYETNEVTEGMSEVIAYGTAVA